MINKDRLKEIKENWFKVSNHLFELGLSANAVAIYCYMCSCSVRYNPSIREICKVYRLGRATAYRAIQELVKASVIILVEKANAEAKKSAVYSLNGPKLWSKIVINSDNDQKLDSESDSES